jgi:diadenosine tetraphosphatase ApaH/serine/threonine PP2A family protein phosphatase
MRIAILSDVHSNLAGLRAVLRDAEADSAIDAVWCLGDIVGYAAEPSETIAELRSRPLMAVAGNHDLAATRLMGVDEFNPVAAEAALWTAGQLSESERVFLTDLPLTLVLGGPAGPRGFTLVHGSLREPAWEYLLDGEQAAAQFGMQTTPYSLVGHSHLLFWVEERADGTPEFHRADDGTTIRLGDTRLILNPGSAGQPRDGDPRVSYVLYDEASATMTWRRVAYDIAATQAAIRAAGLPPFLGDRLAAGR